MNQVARLSLVDCADAEVSIVAQCRLLKVSRSSLYWRPAGVSEDDLRLMRRIDELYLATPFYGARRMVAVLRREGWTVNRKRVRRLMRLMRIEAIYQKPNTSRRHPDHVVYPYLLRGLAIDRPNQVWCADITYVQLAKGFVYLVAVMDWFSRRLLAWRLSTGTDSGFCVEALQDALNRYGSPNIFNTDQGVRCLMHIAKIPNRKARPSCLLRETCREDGKVKNRTLANLSKLPIERIETLRAALRGDPLAPIGSEGFEIKTSSHAAI
jgi:putative transposase